MAGPDDPGREERPDFKGQLEISFSGTLDGRPWSLQHASTPQTVLIKGYLRQEGLVDVPPQAVVKTVSARILQSGVSRRCTPSNSDPSLHREMPHMFNKKKQPPIKSLIAHGTRIEGNVLFTTVCGLTATWWETSAPAMNSPASW
jgi:hypothetical protein